MCVCVYVYIYYNNITKFMHSLNCDYIPPLALVNSLVLIIFFMFTLFKKKKKYHSLIHIVYIIM